jgi:DEAD/DEAH box helicase domain-containing protein
MNIVYFDLETQKTFDEVGGRNNIAALRLACGVTWSTSRNDFKVYWESDVPDLVAELKVADLVVGYNIIGFDYEVLRAYLAAEPYALRSLRTIDMLNDIFRTLGFRIPLDSVAKATLDTTKTAEGLQSVEWFRNGELDKVAEYCKSDVDITRRIYEFGKQNGYILYYSKLGSKLKVKVNWK